MALPYHLESTPPAPTLLGREIIAVDAAKGEVRMSFLAKPEFANRHGSVQGGFISAMLDSATSVAVLATLPENLTSVTMRLETDFLKPAPIGPLFATGRTIERTEREAVSEGTLEGPDGTLYARATARLRIRPRA